MTFRQQIANSFFLCEQPFVSEFAKEFVVATLESERALSQRSLRSSLPQTFSVVCERKEDLVAVRAQLFYSINEHRKALHLPEAEVVAGLSMYTLDTLGENFCASLANSSEALLGAERVEAFRQPYLDVPTQEKLMKLLLLHFGYHGSDAAPLAKQILALLDVQWPPDSSFFELLLETQSVELERPVKEITEKSLREILAVYQAGTKILGRFCRLQQLVLNFLETDFPSLLELKKDRAENADELVLPRRFLTSNILWIAAPEYATYSSASQTESEMLTSQSESMSFYRPGDFQSALVDAFRNSIVQAQLALTQGRAHFWHARSCIVTNMHPQMKLKTSHIEYLIATNRHQVSHDLNSLLTDQFRDQSKVPFLLLADFNPGQLREINSDASGSYSVSEKDLQTFFLDRQEKSLASSPTENASSSAESPETSDKLESLETFSARKALLEFLDGQFDAFAELAEVLHSELVFLDNLAKQYGLNPSRGPLDFRHSSSSFQHDSVARPAQKTEEMFARWCVDETFVAGRPHLVSKVDKALSFLATAGVPSAMIAVGPAHAPTLPSFNVKILNDAFYLMRKKGVALGLPASDTTYRGFWSWLAQKEIPLSFWLLGSEDLETFPAYLAPQNESGIATLSEPLPQTFSTSLEEFLGPNNTFFQPNWTQLFQWKRTPAGNIKMSVTAFESYVECPLRFYLGDVLALEDFASDFSRGNPLEAGNRTHRVAELFLQSLRQVFRHGHLGQALPLFAKLVELLQNESFFLSENASEWLSAFHRIVQVEPGLDESQKLILSSVFVEICEQLFDFDAPKVGSSLGRLEAGITRETVKRTFRRLLEVEHGRLLALAKADIQNVTTLAFVEHPVEFKLGEIVFSGRIDRIDSSPLGFEIYDYKTSKIPKTERPLVFLPSEKKAKNQLSVQAALYSYALALQKSSLESDSESGSATDTDSDSHLPIRSFALYRLKNLDANANSFIGVNFEPALTAHSETTLTIAQEYLAFVERLSAGDFSPCPLHPDSCLTCSFVALCPLGRVHAGIGSEEPPEAHSGAQNESQPEGDAS